MGPQGTPSRLAVLCRDSETLYHRLTEGGSLRLRTFPFGRTAALLHAADGTGLRKALQRHLPALAPLRATWQLIARILGEAERPLSREGMARCTPESLLPFFAQDAAEASGRAVSRKCGPGGARPARRAR